MALAALGFSFYSIGDVFVKKAAAIYSPEQVGFWANIFWIPLILALSNRIGGLIPTLKSKKIHLHLTRAALGMVSFYFMTSGFDKLGMATSYTLIFIAPFIATLLAVAFLGEHIQIHRIMAIIAGFAGVLVVLRPGLIPLEAASMGILFGAVCYAISTIIIRKIGEHEPLLAFSLYNVSFFIVVFGIYLAARGEPMMPAMKDLWLFPCIALFHVFGNFSVSTAFRTGETSSVAPFHYVQLVWGIIFGYTLFGNGIDLWTALGGAIIVGSGIYMIHREHVRHREMTHGVVASGTALE
jgi:drug/metabolite transporter (DMT)-like permease